jgi:hypothetical protein
MSEYTPETEGNTGNEETAPAQDASETNDEQAPEKTEATE